VRARRRICKGAFVERFSGTGFAKRHVGETVGLSRLWCVGGRLLSSILVIARVAWMARIGRALERVA
jgi:hypothetical protein